MITTKGVDAIGQSILPTLIRYIDEYRWRWSIATRIINLRHGAAYTQKELRSLYRCSKTLRKGDD